MHARQVATTAALVLGLAAAQKYPDVSCFSGLCLGATVASPNATRSVNFKPFANETEWAWRVNVTDFTTEGERAIHIAYDFSWPGGGKLGWAFPRFYTPYCAVAMVTWGTAARVTDKYTDQHANSTDCTPILGDACVNAILASSVKRNESAGCFNGLWSHLPECAGTFGLDDYGPYGNHHLALQVYALTNVTESGRPFHIIPAEGANAQLPGLYENAVDMLQVVLLRPPARVTNDTFHPTLHCMRVKTKKEEGSAGSGGGVADNGQGGGAGEKTDDGEGRKHPRG